MYSEKALIHGGDIYTHRDLKPGQKLLDFSANLNPLGMPESVKQAAISAISASEAYPDPLCRELREAISKEEGIPAGQIVCGNGAADLLYRLVWAVKPEKGLVLAPTFAEYELALQNAGAETEIFPLSPEKGFAPDEAVLDAVKPGVSILFFCNPNNPTGITAGREYLCRLAEKCREAGALLVIDECFLSFVEKGAEKSMIPALSRFENLLILKAFTKLYAMAGLRLGFLLCGSEKLAGEIAASGQAWSVSTPAQAAGIAALSERDYALKTRGYVRENRAFLHKTLEEAGAQVFPSEANYLFFRWRDGHLPEELLKHGILIRSCKNYHSLDETYYRIAVRTAEENRAFAAALRQIAGQKG